METVQGGVWAQAQDMAWHLVYDHNPIWAHVARRTAWPFRDRVWARAGEYIEDQACEDLRIGEANKEDARQKKED
jgi:hypothetical protein